MILDAILNLLFGVLTQLLDLFPGFSQTPMLSLGGNANPVGAFVHDVGLQMGKLDPWFNTSFLVTCIGIMSSMLGAFAVIYIALWVYQHLPVIGD